jgi:hypothetical protein
LAVLSSTNGLPDQPTNDSPGRGKAQTAASPLRSPSRASQNGRHQQPNGNVVQTSSSKNACSDGGGVEGGGAGVGDTLSVTTSSEVDSCTEGGSSPNNSVSQLEYSDPKQEKSYNIALELLTTEKTYVEVLRLIDQVKKKIN